MIRFNVVHITLVDITSLRVFFVFSIYNHSRIFVEALVSYRHVHLPRFLFFYSIPVKDNCMVNTGNKVDEHLLLISQKKGST